MVSSCIHCTSRGGTCNEVACIGSVELSAYRVISSCTAWSFSGIIEQSERRVFDRPIVSGDGSSRDRQYDTSNFLSCKRAHSICIVNFLQVQKGYFNAGLLGTYCSIRLEQKFGSQLMINSGSSTKHVARPKQLDSPCQTSGES